MRAKEEIELLMVENAMRFARAAYSWREYLARLERELIWGLA